MFYDPQALADGRADLVEFVADVRPARDYATDHIERFASTDAGFLFQYFLDEHEKFEGRNQELFTQLRELWTNAANHLVKTRVAYDQANDDARASISTIFKDLEKSDTTPPLGPTPEGHGTRQEMPSVTLVPPVSLLETGSWVFDVLSWPDNLSIGSWTREALNLLLSSYVGHEVDVFEWLHGQFCGDWDQISMVGDAWSKLQDYLLHAGGELQNRMQIMFEGWYGDDALGAHQAGEYFADVQAALTEASATYTNLARVYQDVAMASYCFFQSLWGYVDAAIDAWAVSLLGFSSVAEAIAALVSGGSTGFMAVATAIAALVEFVSAAWGTVASTCYIIGTFVSLIDAACTNIDFVTLPEG